MPRRWLSRGWALVSTKKPLSTAKASITLTLPTKKIKKSVANRAVAEALAVSPGRHHLHRPTPGGRDPRVPGPVEPSRLCAPRPGRPSARATSSRRWATSRPTPTRRPPLSPCSSSSTGYVGPDRHRLHAEAQREDGGPSDRLQEGGGGSNTPCVAGAELIGGSAAHDSLYAQDTVYFTGADPAMGRR